MVSPKKTEYFKVLQSKSFSGSFRIKLSNEARLVVRSLFSALIDSEVTLENKKRRLTSAPGFSSYESYEIIKGKYKSFILKEDVRNFFYFFNFFFKFYLFFY